MDLAQPDITRQDKPLPIRWLNTPQLARYIELAEDTIRQYVSRRKIPYHKIPGSNQVRFDIEQIDAWMQKGLVRTATDELQTKAEEKDAQVT